MDSNQALQNFVFISYNHKDVKWAQWLQKKLEWYRLPTEAHNEFSDSRYIRPVFRDRDNLTLEQGVLNVNGSEYSFSCPDTTIETTALPGYCRMRKIPVSLHTDRFYADENISVQMGMGLHQHVALQMHRDSRMDNMNSKNVHPYFHIQK